MSRKSKYDQYYINPERIPWMLDIILKKCVPTTDYFMDVAAGNGEIAARLRKICGDSRVFAYDIDPKADFIQSEDFLKHNLLCSESTVTTICFPPFGKNVSLATRFFNKCTKVSKFIVTIFPMSIKKQYFQSKLDPYFHIISSADLPYNSFILHGKSYNVKCCFQIWEKLEYEREVYTRIKHLNSPHFDFVAIDQDPNVAIIFTGRKAGKVISCKEALKYTKVYYIKIHEDILKENSNIYKLDMSEVANCTVAINSVTKSEITYAINLLMIELLTL